MLCAWHMTEMDVFIAIELAEGQSIYLSLSLFRRPPKTKETHKSVVFPWSPKLIRFKDCLLLAALSLYIEVGRPVL